MIETSISSGTQEPTYKIEDGVRKVLRWKKNERMGGMVPVWEKAPDTAQQKIADNLSAAASGKPNDSFDSALSYAEQGHTNYEPQEFGFGDLIDMVNPLQHIPIVGHIYREITGDEIRPIAQIIGGGVFGGPAGIAGGLINTVVEYETGQDVAGNVISIAATGEAPQYRSARMNQSSNTPEKALNQAIKDVENGAADLPGTAISFADLGHNTKSGKSYEYKPAANGRTAGTTMREAYNREPAPTPREPITQFKLSPMPLNLDMQLMIDDN